MSSIEIEAGKSFKGNAVLGSVIYNLWLLNLLIKVASVETVRLLIVTT